MQKLAVAVVCVCLSLAGSSRCLSQEDVDQPATEEAPETPELEESSPERPAVQLHGFGNWAFGLTDHNQYLGGDSDGDYRHVLFGLNVSAQLGERFNLAAQVDWEVEHDETETELDFAFVDFMVSDAVHVRAGQVKQPFGIYGEIFDVVTLRPFLDLPQAVYGPVGMVAEAYSGVGVTGLLPGSAWEVRYDLYGGALNLEEPNVLEEALEGAPGEDDEAEREVENAVGGRLEITPPVTGLSFGFSGYMGTLRDDEEREEEHLSTFGAHVNYLGDPWSLQIEVVQLHEQEENEETVLSGYLETSYNITPHWEVVGRFEHLETDLEEEVPSELSSFLEHREVALGLNYIFNSGLMIKASVHDVDGNRFAREEEDLEEAEPEENTRLFQLGLAFTF